MVIGKETGIELRRSLLEQHTDNLFRLQNNKPLIGDQQWTEELLNKKIKKLKSRLQESERERSKR